MPAGSATRCGHPVERVEDAARPAARTAPAAPSERELRKFHGGHPWRRGGYARIVSAPDTAARLREAEPHA